MADGDRVDRRQAGVHKTVSTNGNGDREVTYQFNVKRIRAVAGMLSAVFTLILLVIGGMWAGVRVGIGTGVQDAIEIECDPGGMIDDHIQQTAYEMGQEIQGVIQDDLDDFNERMEDVEKGQVAIIGSVDALKTQSERSVEEIKMLLRRAIEGSP